MSILISILNSLAHVISNMKKETEEIITSGAPQANSKFLKIFHFGYEKNAVVHERDISA